MELSWLGRWALVIGIGLAGLGGRLGRPPNGAALGAIARGRAGPRREPVVFASTSYVRRPQGCVAPGA